MKKLFPILSLAVLALPLHGQLIISAPGTELLDFESAVTNVVQYNASFAYGALVDTPTPNGTGNFGLLSLGWSAWASGIGIAGQPSGTWTPCVADVDGDANLYDNYIIAGTAVARGGTGLGGQSVPVLPAGGSGILFGQGNAAPWRDNGFALRIQNGAGQTLTDISVAVDAWNSDPDTAVSNFIVSYSTDNTNFTVLDTLVGARTTTAAYEVSNLDHWSSLQQAGGTLADVDLADGASLYLRFVSQRPSGSSGGNWVMDNISITTGVVPEPSTSAACAAALALALVAFRRRA